MIAPLLTAGSRRCNGDGFKEWGTVAVVTDKSLLLRTLAGQESF
jgi:hypothetical protein